MSRKNYYVIENTPGYLPDDEDPPSFDSYAEALNHLVTYNKELREEVGFQEGEGMVHINRVEPILNGQFSYYDPRKQNDLGRFVEIVRVEEEDSNA